MANPDWRTEINIPGGGGDYVTNDWSGIESGIPSDTDNFLFNDGTDNKKITKNNLVNLVPYIGENRCNVSYFSLYANSVGNTVIPDGFAKYDPLFEIGKTYVISGYVNGEPTGQVQVQTASGYTNYNFNTPFTITEEVINLYFRGTPDVLNTFSEIKVEEGTKATPFIPGNIASVIDYTSLQEQIVPGEFWLGEDGTSRQVYCRTFKGTLSSDETYTAITGGIWNAQIVQGYINENNQYNMPFNLIHATSGEAELNYLATMYVNRVSKILIISYSPNSLAKGADYVLTVKYTKP